MSFRLRLTIALLGLSCLAAGLTALVVGRDATNRIREGMARDLEGIVATAALGIDGDAFARIVSPRDPAIGGVRAGLERVAAANPDLSNLYAGRISGDSFVYIVDGYAASGELAPMGERLPAEAEMRTAAAGTPSANAELVTDRFGTWISGYAPIRNGSGTVVGVLGADHSAADVYAARGSFATRAAWTVLFILLAGAALSVLLGRMLSRPLEELLGAFSRLEDGDPSTKLEIDSPPEFARLAAAFNRAEVSVIERDTIKGIFGTFLEKNVADKILKDLGTGGIPGELRNVTVLFSDIRGYTSWSEDKHPAELVKALNEYFSKMIDIVVKHGGTIDKFIGDAIMVVFGGPQPLEDHADRAVAAGVEMQAAMRRLKKDFAMGIGINTGDALLGTIGSKKRMSYTAMGDNVNLAQRLESKALPGQVLLSRATYQALKEPERFVFGRLDPMLVKGKKTPIDILEVRGLREREKEREKPRAGHVEKSLLRKRRKRAA